MPTQRLTDALLRKAERPHRGVLRFWDTDIKGFVAHDLPLRDRFMQDLESFEVKTAAANIAGGDSVLVGSIFGVAATNAVAGEEVEIVTLGVYELPKLSTAVIAHGDRVA